MKLNVKLTHPPRSNTAFIRFENAAGCDLYRAETKTIAPEA